MVTISDKEHKAAKFFAGRITLALPNCERTEWNFDLVRTTNGKTMDEVNVDEAQFEEAYDTGLPGDKDYNTKQIAMRQGIEILQKTVLACVAKDLVQWKPQDKN